MEKSEMKSMVTNNGNPTREFYEKPIMSVQKKKHYALLDKTRGAYLPMSEKINDAVALRDFDTIVNEKGNLVNKYPNDFEMWYMGYFNEETGEFTNEKKKIGEAKEYIREEK